MGGVAGHMSHLYENPELTFKEIKDVFAKASNGELEGTEKTDGQNLFISYSVQTGRAKAARNKGNIKTGGMTAEELAQKFAGRGGLEKAFVESFRTFEKAVQSLDPEIQMAIFGPDANVYYNAEIQDPGSANIINYDTRTLNIHQVGHAEFNKETGTVRDVDISKNVRALDKALEVMQKAIADENFNLQKNAIIKLRALGDDSALNSAVERLENITRREGISDNQTIADYIVAKITPFLKKQVELPDANMKLLLKRLFGVKGVTFNNVVKGLDRDAKEKVREIVKAQKELMKNAIIPIEDVVHDFSVEMLKGLHSAFILDNPKEVMRLRSELKRAIAAIESSGDETAIKILHQHMRKLKAIENVSTAVEGFVFDYEGLSYKFTGNFAPMNQILGLFRYGRGGKTLELTEEDEDMDISFINDYDVDISGYKSVALVPGGFKPPHRGHLDMIKAVTMADRILIIMGSGGKSPRAIGGRAIDYNTAIAIWTMYLEDAGIRNYDFIEVAEGKTPIGEAYDILEQQSQPGQTIYMLASEKDAGRFDVALEKYTPEGVELRVVETPATKSKTGEQLSARFMRSFIGNGNYEEFLDYIPDTSKDRAAEIFAMLGGKKKVSEDILRMVESLLDEADYQKSYRITQHLKRWKDMHGKGPQDPGSAYPNKRPDYMVYRIKEDLMVKEIMEDLLKNDLLLEEGITDIIKAAYGAVKTNVAKIKDMAESVLKKIIAKLIDQVFRLIQTLRTKRIGKFKSKGYTRNIKRILGILKMDEHLKTGAAILMVLVKAFGGLAANLSGESAAAWVENLQNAVEVLRSKGPLEFIKAFLPAKEIEGLIGGFTALKKDIEDDPRLKAFSQGIQSHGRAAAAGVPATNEEKGKRSKKYFGKKFYDIAMLHGDEMSEEELEEISTMAGGNVEGAAMSRDDKKGKASGPWHGLDTEKENRKQKKNSKIPHGTPLVEDDEFIEEVLNYLLNKSGA